MVGFVVLQFSAVVFIIVCICCCCCCLHAFGVLAHFLRMLGHLGPDSEETSNKSFVDLIFVHLHAPLCHAFPGQLAKINVCFVQSGRRIPDKRVCSDSFVFFF